MDTKEIGIIIKERRKHLGVNQQTLADLAGVGLNTLVAIERGGGQSAAQHPVDHSRHAWITDGYQAKDFGL